MQRRYAPGSHTPSLHKSSRVAFPKITRIANYLSQASDTIDVVDCALISHPSVQSCIITERARLCLRNVTCPILSQPSFDDSIGVRTCPSHMSNERNGLIVSRLIPRRPPLSVLLENPVCFVRGARLINCGRVVIAFRKSNEVSDLTLKRSAPFISTRTIYFGLVEISNFGCRKRRRRRFRFRLRYFGIIST